MIDKPRTPFLDFLGFVGRVPRIVQVRTLVLTVGVAACLLPGCAPSSSSQQAEGDLTSGRIKLICPPEAMEVIERSRRAFERLYPEAHIDVVPGNSRDAVSALLGARADVAVITRELLPEERRAAVQGKLELEGYRFARDAAAIIVHPENPVLNLAVEDVRRIYRGDVGDWSEIGGRRGPIVPVVQPPEADLTAFFIQEVMAGEPMRAPSLCARSDEQVVRFVQQRPNALGYVSLLGARRGGRALHLAALKGLPYYGPDPESVHEGRYPVTRYFNLYVRSRGPALANGFITYVTSFEGQKLIQASGLVPTSVPVRFVHRSPMLSTHPQGDSTRTP